MPTAFQRDTAVTAQGDGLYAAHVSEQWRAGRGPHGGYLAAIVVRALSETVADPSRAPRSLTIHYARAPAPGPILIRTEVQRAGRSLSTLSARMEQDGKLMALALAAFSVPWEGPELSEQPMPVVEAPDANPAERVPEINGRPRFTQFNVMQPRFGAMPFSGGDGPMESGGWLGLIEPQELDAAALAYFSDAWWSPPFARLEQPYTSPTIDLTIHFRRALPDATARPGDLVLARFQTHLVHDGLFENDCVVWSPSGKVLAQARQLALLLALPPAS